MSVYLYRYDYFLSHKVEYFRPFNLVYYTNIINNNCNRLPIAVFKVKYKLPF